MAEETKAATKAAAKAVAETTAVASTKMQIGKDIASALLLGAGIGVALVLLKMAWEQRRDTKECRDALFMLRQSEAVRMQRETQREEALHAQQQQQQQQQQRRRVPVPQQDPQQELSDRQHEPQRQANIAAMHPQLQVVGVAGHQPIDPRATVQAAEPPPPINPRLELLSDPR